MKLLGFYRKTKGAAGSALLFAVLIAGLIGALLATYLTLVRSQNEATMRSQAWNAAIPMIEAGIEEALAHLNCHGLTNLPTDGWQSLGGQYVKQRSVGDGFYIVGILDAATPVITSQGYVPLPLMASADAPLFALISPDGSITGKPSTHLGRGIRVLARRDRLFAKGLVAKGQINLNGKNIETDSFDSSDPAYSTAGLYDSTKAKDNGDVATNSGLVNSVDVGNADVFGKVSTGPGGSVAIGPTGAVGCKAWHDAKNKGIEPGSVKDDMNVVFPDILMPFSGGAFFPGPGVIDGTTYNYVLGNGKYQLSTLSMSGSSKMVVTGNAILYVPGDVSISGTAFIEIRPGGSLKLYVGGASASLGGNGVLNKAGNAINFFYYGLPSNTSLDVTGNGTFTGVIYAPNADLSLSGSGSTDTDFVGASISRTVLMNGNFKFHYDEALAKYGAPRAYVVTSWNEMQPTEMSALERYIGYVSAWTIQ